MKTGLMGRRKKEESGLGRRSRVQCRFDKANAGNKDSQLEGSRMQSVCHRSAQPLAGGLSKAEADPEEAMGFL